MVECAPMSAWHPWVGGRYREVDGRRVWYIRKRVGGGARVEFALDVSTEQDALVELALFRRDPAGYQTSKRRAAAAQREATGEVRLDGPTIGAFVEHCFARVRKGDLTGDYVRQTLAPYLAAWGRALRARDLRQVTLEDLQAALRGWKTAQHKRVVALKAFTSWAREEKPAPKLRRQDDPTIDLKTPAIIPAKSVEAKGYPMVTVERVYAELISQAARDMLCLRAKLGLHDSEIARIASGKGALRKVSDSSGIEGVIVFSHLKKGKGHAVSCDAQAFAAAERLQARGRAVSRSAMKTMVGRVAIRLHGCGGVTTKRLNGKGQPVWETAPCPGCDPLQPNELRHSFATWATTVGEEVQAQNQRGVDLAKVAEHMGHLSKRTTAVFYVGDRIPMMIRLPLRLEHPNDPNPQSPEPSPTSRPTIH
jgi:integrase